MKYAVCMGVNIEENIEAYQAYGAPGARVKSNSSVMRATLNYTAPP